MFTLAVTPAPFLPSESLGEPYWHSCKPFRFVPHTLSLLKCKEPPLHLDRSRLVHTPSQRSGTSLTEEKAVLNFKQIKGIPAISCVI